MYAVISCLRDAHDLRLVLVAAAICVISAFAGFSGYHRVAAAQRSAVWMLGPGLVAGMGIWATHFMAMLAYQPMLEISYRLDLTLASMMVPVLGMTGAFRVVGGRPDPGLALAGGALAGGSIALMHFMGIAAMRLPADLAWSPGLVTAACAIGVSGAALAFLLDQGRGLKLRAGPALLVAAICGLHFTAMGAVALQPNMDRDLGQALISREALALATAAAVLILLGAAVAIGVIERIAQRATLGALAGALNSAPSALAFFDRTGRLTFWNAPYGVILGLYGVGLRNGMPLTAMGEALSKSEALRHRLEGGRMTRHTLDEIVAEGEFPTPDGRVFRIEVGDTPDGGFVVVMHDITTQTDAAKTLERARDAAEAASRAKSEFLANMSHEVRTPLNGVLGMAQVMARHPLSPDQHERLSVICESGATLLTLLDDVLDIAKIESGGLGLEDGDFDLAARVRSACAPAALEAGPKGVDFTLQIAPDLTGPWRGDGARLAQMVGALVSNAMKFTERGEVRVTATRLAAGDMGDGGVQITVCDSGIGMSPDHLNGLFEAFAQADSSSTRRHGGAGLGLAMAYHLARLMGGELSAASALGEGSTFTLRLPLKPSTGETSAIMSTAPDASLSEDHPLRVLAAEDNANNQRVLQALLAPLDVDLTLAQDGDAAVEAFRNGAFDIVLMDIQMPRMNGIEAARAIRALEAERGLAPTPIVAVTANVMTHQIQEYLAAGMDDAISKPLRAESLYEALSAAQAAASPSSAEGEMRSEGAV